MLQRLERRDEVLGIITAGARYAIAWIETWGNWTGPREK
jgi:hypothetical protein